MSVRVRERESVRVCVRERESVRVCEGERESECGTDVHHAARMDRGHTCVGWSRTLGERE